MTSLEQEKLREFEQRRALVEKIVWCSGSPDFACLMIHALLARLGKSNDYTAGSYAAMLALITASTHDLQSAYDGTTLAMAQPPKERSE